MLKIRHSRDRLIFNMGISILGKDDLYIETGPCLCCVSEAAMADPEGVELVGFAPRDDDGGSSRSPEGIWEPQPEPETGITLERWTKWVSQRLVGAGLTRKLEGNVYGKFGHQCTLFINLILNNLPGLMCMKITMVPFHPSGLRAGGVLLY